ncbi:hypothetical protein [Azospirillum brasilense]|uniref:hypothetical protein n=1 Tax=Azospirillum brasilense TaxID=192 RepID=UPI000E685BB7|nr:hypothetical protein [Azospirillum brasilense]NUB26250.1 hypothetical protein [Azospirillum brasilense]NUB34238.1 hypothetical protein [Azospirillum brasilense]RIV99236.1 hypothetical protein D2T81_23870 [Azospirillum brasilense]
MTTDTLEAPKADAGKGLAIIADLTPEIFTPEKAAEIVADVRREVLAIDRDVSTKKGREAIASMAAKIARSKTAADNFGKQLKADYKARVDAIDGIRRVFWDGLEALQKEFRAPLTEFEEAEKRRVAGHESALADIARLIVLDGVPTTDAIADRLTVAKAVDTSTFQEFTSRAEAAKADAVGKLEAMLKAAQERDAERAELERLRQEAAEREAQAARERAEREQQEREERAAEQARQEAERAAAAERMRVEQEARQIQEKAAREKAEAEERAAQAERDRQDAERRAKEAEERAQQRAEEVARKERQRIEDERKAEEEAQRRREADRTHRATVNNAAVAALTAAGLSYGDAKTAITAIAKGDVPHVAIAY